MLFSDVFLALLPFRTAVVAQLVEESLHGNVLNAGAGLEQGDAVLACIHDAAQLHRQTDPLLAELPPYAELSAQDVIVIGVLVQFAQTDIILSARGDEISILQQGGVIESPLAPLFKGRFY
jgi:hypothetical protein